MTGKLLLIRSGYCCCWSIIFRHPTLNVNHHMDMHYVECCLFQSLHECGAWRLTGLKQSFEVGESLPQMLKIESTIVYAKSKHLQWLRKHISLECMHDVAPISPRKAAMARCYKKQEGRSHHGHG